MMENIMCPICGKAFKQSENTYCWIREGLYTFKLVCSWQCFKKRVNEQPIKEKRNNYKVSTSIQFT